MLQYLHFFIGYRTNFLADNSEDVGARMKEFTRRVAALVAALVCGTVVGMLVLPFGLVVVEFIILPLTFGIAALFAALGASWAGILLSPDNTSSRILPVVGVSEATAGVVVVLLLIPGVGVSLFRYVGSPAVLLGAVMVLIGLSTSWAAWHFRKPVRHTAKDALMTLGLVGLAVLIFVGTIYVASLFGMVGA